ncbi:adenosine kinase [Pyrenophora seminiperda CCB06]|uniref:Adenosine kinase n=1 Tax=Pyrenophora seminiperda CCB06 TaxID=1302712 RepID=A0A3M7M8N2_9PLEO|nr:adenosine kinase [Pyrenophora seminiperda CCB06]
MSGLFLSHHNSINNNINVISYINPTPKMPGKYELLCLENPLLDIQGVGDQALLDKYGLKANDAILADAEKHMGLYEDLIQNYKAVLIAGGAAQNTARGAAYMLEPNSVVYIGCIGKDKYGETLEKISADAGVKTEYLYDEKTPTGRCGVVITGHNRSLCTDLAAANNYKLEHLKQERIWKQFFKDPLDEILPYVDILIGNETEAATFAESHGYETTDLKEIAKKIASLPKKNTKRSRTVVITQGTNPTIAVSAKDGGDVDTKEVPVHAITEDKINDTNGAGDAFAGGFVAGIVQGKPLEKAIDMGQWLAKLSIQELGPSYPQPKQTYSN